MRKTHRILMIENGIFACNSVLQWLRYSLQVPLLFHRFPSDIRGSIHYVSFSKNDINFQFFFLQAFRKSEHFLWAEWLAQVDGLWCFFTYEPPIHLPWWKRIFFRDVQKNWFSRTKYIEEDTEFFRCLSEKLRTSPFPIVIQLVAREEAKYPKNEEYQVLLENYQHLFERCLSRPCQWLDSFYSLQPADGSYPSSRDWFRLQTLSLSWIMNGLCPLSAGSTVAELEKALF